MTPASVEAVINSPTTWVQNGKISSANSRGSIAIKEITVKAFNNKEIRVTRIKTRINFLSHDKCSWRNKSPERKPEVEEYAICVLFTDHYSNVFFKIVETFNKIKIKFFFKLTITFKYSMYKY